MAVVLGVVFVIVAVLVESVVVTIFFCVPLLLSLLHLFLAAVCRFYWGFCFCWRLHVLIPPKKFSYTMDAFVNFVAVVVTIAKFSAN